MKKIPEKSEKNTKLKRLKLFRNIKEFFDGNRLWFFIFAVLSLMIPDLVIKTNVLFISFRADGGKWNEILQCNIVPLLFSTLWIIFMLYICIWMLPKKAGRITFVVLASLANIFMISQYIYHTMFGRYFMLSAIFLATEGMAYTNILYKYISLWLILFTILSIGSLVLTCMLWKKQTVRKRFWFVVLIPIALIVITSIKMTASSEEKANNKAWSTFQNPRYVYADMADPDRCIRIMGIYQFMVRNVTYPLFIDTGFGEEDYETVDLFIETKMEEASKKPDKNEMTGIFKDKNVMVVMLESMDDWMITEETTPTLYRIMNEGINFEKHIATPFGGGLTFNSEFAFNTGYYTPKSSSSASIYGYNKFPHTLPVLFKEKGYTALQFHYNKMEFYNRSTMHEAFGYEDYISFMDYMSEGEAELDSNAMLLEDEQIYEKMVKNDKFFDYIITYSAHLPYTSDDKLSVAMEKYPDLIDKTTVEEFKTMMTEADALSEEIDFSEYDEEKWQSLTAEYNNARLLAKDTDEFVRMLVEKLERDGLLDNTVLVFFADHYNYGFSDQKIVKGLSLLGGERFIEETPFFIYYKGMEPMKVTKLSSTMDILPTLSNMFGLRWFGGYIGEDIFDPNNKGFMYFNNMSWYDGNFYRDSSYDEANATPKEREYVAEMDRKMMESININDIIIAGDYFARQK